jgi:hypothetical protein
MSTAASTPPPPPDMFWRKLFRAFHERHRRTEPHDARDYKNVRMALYYLRTYTGMTGEQMAAKIGISAGQLNMFEIRGGILRPEQCKRCAMIARDFFYPKLAEYFDLAEMKNSRMVYKRPRKESPDFAGE